MRRWLIGLLLVVSLSGCMRDAEETLEPSPFFTTRTGTTLQGVEGKLAILTPGFVAGKGNKYMWHFWGTQKELSQKPFRVEAIDVNTGKKYQALMTAAATPAERYVWEYSSIAGRNNGADAHVPSSMKLPAPGLWKLNVYLGGRLFGSIVVEVNDA